MLCSTRTIEADPNENGKQIFQKERFCGFWRKREHRNDFAVKFTFKGGEKKNMQEHAQHSEKSNKLTWYV